MRGAGYLAGRTRSRALREQTGVAAGTEARTPVRVKYFTNDFRTLERIRDFVAPIHWAPGPALRQQPRSAFPAIVEVLC